MRRIMSRNSLAASVPTISGDQLRHDLAARFLPRVELRLVVPEDAFRLGLQRVLHPDLGLGNARLDLRTRAIGLTGRPAYRVLPLDGFKNQSSIPTRRPALAILVYFDIYKICS